VIVVFFIYGLAFFLLGVVIFVYPKKGSRYHLADSLRMVALFGLFHGANEWVDMFILIYPEHAATLKVIRMLVLPISFCFLIQFGLNMMVSERRLNPVWKVAPLGLFALWWAVTAASGNTYLTGDIAARYLLCLSGILATSYALTVQARDLAESASPDTIRNLRLSAGGFLIYGFLAGLVVPQAGFFPASVLNYATFIRIVGMPVQIFRACCAVAMAYLMGRILNIFEWETVDSLRIAKEDLEKKVERRTASLLEINRELKEAISKVRTLSGMLPICSSCKKIRDDRGYWSQIETYISQHSEAEFSHSICPDCARRLYPDFYDKMKAGEEAGEKM
jgi:hypothetical protein